MNICVLLQGMTIFLSTKVCTTGDMWERQLAIQREESLSQHTNLYVGISQTCNLLSGLQRAARCALFIVVNGFCTWFLMNVDETTADFRRKNCTQQATKSPPYHATNNKINNVLQ